MLYTLFIERIAETHGQPILPGVVLALGLLYVGTQWIRGKAAGR